MQRALYSKPKRNTSVLLGAKFGVQLGTFSKWKFCRRWLLYIKTREKKQKKNPVVSVISMGDSFIA